MSLCGTSEVEGVESFKYLGVVLSSNFTWSERVEHVIFKVNQRSGLLRRIKHLPDPFCTRCLYYNSLVFPILNYAYIVWGDKNNAALMKNQQLLQKTFVFFRNGGTSQLGWLSSEQRMLFHHCLYIYNMCYRISSHRIELLRNSDVHSYSTRNKDD